MNKTQIPPFFVDDKFFAEVEDYLLETEWTDDEIRNLPDDWSIEIGLASKEPVCKLDIDKFINEYIVDQLCEETLPEDPDDTIKQIEKCVKENIDFTKLNESLPRLWYLNERAKDGVLTKKDLMEAIK